MYEIGKYNENGSPCGNRDFIIFFKGDFKLVIFFSFLILNCFRIRIDVNDVQRRTKKEFVARVYLPSLGWIVIRKEII